MTRKDLPALILAWNLAIVAGSVDAEGYLFLHGYFVSFMSGNTTQAMVGLGSGHDRAVRIAGGLIGLFVLGVAGCRLAGGDGLWRRRRVLGSVATLLAAAALAAAGGWNRVAIVLATLGMGGLNDVVQRAGSVNLSATYMTGTLVKLGQGLADALRGGPRWGWAPYLALWSGLAMGGLLGTLLFPAVGLNGLWAAAGWCAVLAALSRPDPGR